MPTCLEQGVNLSYDLMYYVMFPKGTDPAICQKFAQAFKEISEMPEYAEEIKTPTTRLPISSTPRSLLPTFRKRTRR